MPRDVECELDPQHVANVLSTIAQATPGERDAGMAWYPAYGAYIESQGLDAGYTRDQAVSLFAMLSARTPIAQNRSLFRDALLTGPDSMRTMAVRKAIAARILDDPLTPGQYVNGLKTSSFRRNLLGDYSCVTVDRHCASMVYGEHLFQRKGIDDRTYRYCERVVKAAGLLLDMEPAMVQAVGWIVWRRLLGMDDMGGMEGMVA